jgi:hypothetical protein
MHDVDSGLWWGIIHADGGRCVHCGSDEELQVDHVRPRHAGGYNVPVNLVTLCRSCNEYKSCYWPGHGYHAKDPTLRQLIRTDEGFDQVTCKAEMILDSEIMHLRNNWDESIIKQHIWRYFGCADGDAHW